MSPIHGTLVSLRDPPTSMVVGAPQCVLIPLVLQILFFFLNKNIIGVTSDKDRQGGVPSLASRNPEDASQG